MRSLISVSAAKRIHLTGINRAPVDRLKFLMGRSLRQFSYSPKIFCGVTLRVQVLDDSNNYLEILWVSESSQEPMTIPSLQTHSWVWLMNPLFTTSILKRA